MIKKTRTRFMNAAPWLAALFLIAFTYALVPPPQRSSAQFFGQGTFGGTSTNIGNAYSITINNWGANLKGVPITFIPNTDNTGPSTLNVSSIGAVTVQRLTSAGLASLSGSELRAGVLTTVSYDGTNFQILSPVSNAPIGSTVDLRGSSVPPGYLIEDGSCVSQTTYAALFSVIATSYGSCSAGLFALPDSRGTVFGALDNQGSNGSAGRITVGGSGCPATAIIFCGNQITTLVTGNLPPYTPQGTPILDTLALSSNISSNATGGTSNITVGGFSASATMGFSIVSSSLHFNGTAQGGTSTPFPRLMPTLFGTRAIKF